MKILRWITLLVCASFLAGCSLFGAKDNTIPPAPLVKFEPMIQTSLLWKTSVGSGTNKNYLRLTPVIIGNTAFTDDYEGHVTAVNMMTGKTIWQVSLKTHLTCGVGHSKTALFVGTEDGQLIALSQKEGSKIWSTPMSSEILASPVESDGVVVAKSIDGNLVGFNAKNGNQLWTYSQTVPNLILHAASQPQIYQGVVLAGFANGQLAALKLKTGEVLWVQTIAMPKGTTDIERMVDIDVNPIVIEGIVYIATYQGDLAALNLKNGQIIWQHRISSYAGITADDNSIYVSDATSHVWVFDQDSGAVLWRQTALNARMITGPASLGNYLLVADQEGYLHWMAKKDGSFVYRNIANDSGSIVTPVISGDKVLVYTQNGELYCYHIVSFFPPSSAREK